MIISSRSSWLGIDDNSTLDRFDCWRDGPFGKVGLIAEAPLFLGGNVREKLIVYKKNNSYY